MEALVTTHYKVVCQDAEGFVKWIEEFDNLVVTEGLNTLLTRSFKTLPADVNWFVGLKAGGTVAAADTMASHVGWAELTPYSNATRPSFVPGTVASGQVDNSANTANFSINATATVAGILFSSNSAKGGTTGLLYGAGDFSTARNVVNLDTLAVTVTLKVTAA